MRLSRSPREARVHSFRHATKVARCLAERAQGEAEKRRDERELDHRIPRPGPGPEDQARGAGAGGGEAGGQDEPDRLR